MIHLAAPAESARPIPGYTVQLGRGIKGLTIGVIPSTASPPHSPLSADLDAELQAAMAGLDVVLTATQP